MAELKNPNQKMQLLTVRIGEQAFGLPVTRVQDVLRPQKITKIPLAKPEILGLINLRGRIVTVIDLKKCLELGESNAALDKKSKSRIIVVEYKGELYSLAVDEVGDVLDLPESNFENTPENLSTNWKRLTKGVFKLQNILLLVLEVDHLINLNNK